METKYCSCQTPIGPIAIAWNDQGICRLQLPEATNKETLESLKRHLPEAIPSEPEPWVENLISRLCKHLKGETQDFSDVKLDLSSCSEFSLQVYRACRSIAGGTVKTYGELAENIGKEGSSRAVGRALGANPVAIIIPCHRVIGKGGNLTGFSAYGSCSTKLRLLSIEGALISERIELNVC